MSDTIDTTASSEEAVIAKVATVTTGKEKTVKIKFLLSPTGRFNLAYGPGEKGVFPKLQAEELIEAGFAELTK